MWGVELCMSWFQEILEGNRVENAEALDALRELAEADSYEKCIVAEGRDHHMVFFEGVVDGDGALFEVSVTPDWSELNTDPIRTMPGSVNNVFEYGDGWSDRYVSNELPSGLLHD